MTAHEAAQLTRIADLAQARGLTLNYDRRNGVRVIRRTVIGGAPGFVRAFRHDYAAAEAFVANYTSALLDEKSMPPAVRDVYKAFRP